MILVQHENVISIESVFYVENEKSKGICVSMSIGWMGDLNRMIKEFKVCGQKLTEE